MADETRERLIAGLVKVSRLMGAIASTGRVTRALTYAEANEVMYAIGAAVNALAALGPNPPPALDLCVCGHNSSDHTPAASGLDCNKCGCDKFRRLALAALTPEPGPTPSSPSREDREQALRECAESMRLRRMAEFGVPALLPDAAACMVEARRLLQLDPTPTEDK